ncbi:MAG: GTPase Era [Acidobacteria bacterium]|nr:GTPase Era [Acidobacteriota bacterium]
MPFRAGFAAIVGRPNAGKSTLVNQLVGQKVAIVSPKPQTTRNRISGIVNRKSMQLVLIDTPGMHHPETALGRQMVNEIEQALDGIDVLALIVDAAAEFGSGDRYVLDRVRKFRGPRVLFLNKIDRIPKSQLLPLMARYGERAQFAEVLPISALTGEGLPLVLEKFKELLPVGSPFFPKDQFTDVPERFLAAEIIREKAITATREEVPHALAVLIDKFEEGKSLVRIHSTLYVERDGQKGILIGKSGTMLKRIGTAARLEMEALFGTKVFLELFVKVQADWRSRPAFVRQLDWRYELERMGETE